MGDVMDSPRRGSTVNGDEWGDFAAEDDEWGDGSNIDANDPFSTGAATTTDTNADTAATDDNDTNTDADPFGEDNPW